MTPTTAMATKPSTDARAAGVPMNVRRSREARRGRLLRGFLSATPQHQEQRDDGRIGADAQQAHGFENDEQTIAGSSAQHSQPSRPQSVAPGRFCLRIANRWHRVMSTTDMKYSAPMSATGTPATAPKRLVYASVRPFVALISQMLLE